uniref:ATP synthase F0 subunit 8 n=1 Tax=Nodularia breviconcha TaxID=675836 RepID=A0A7M3UKW3_9BIVA|nr:ATP synthase F0 subunit 8 [Nodularia douglasiae]QOI12533.1 ATP synthase F0 subunit 8 [Nodularia breviconcha]UIF91952.1 ATP synthase F0 subunit 8 [Nodularia douglasiae]
MPQLSPMSWILVIGIFLVCLICFMVIVWWVTESKYSIKYIKNDYKISNSKKSLKWGFGGILSK